MRVKLLVLSAILTVLIIIAGGAVYLAGSMLSNPTHATIAVAESLRAEPVQIKSSSGNMLQGSWIPGGDKKPAVLLMHGVRADRRALFRRAEFLKRRGYSVLMFDFQSHGETSGQRITFGYLEGRDARHAFEFMKRKAPSSPTGVVGISLGGASALLANLEADCMVLEAVYPDIRTAIHNRLRRWLGPLAGPLTPLFVRQLKIRENIDEFQLRPIDHIGAFKKPVLILSGSMDLHTTVKDTEALFAKANEPKKLVFFEGAAHQDLYEFDPAKYEAILGDFLKESLEK